MGQMLKTSEELRDDLFFKGKDWSVHFLLIGFKSRNGEIDNTGETKKDQRSITQTYSQNEDICL